MRRHELWRIAAKTTGVLVGALAVVVVLTAMPSHRGPARDVQAPQAASQAVSPAPDAAMTAMGNDSDRHAEHHADADDPKNDHRMDGMDHDSKRNEVAAVASMTPGHQHEHMGLHMKMTAMRAPSANDAQRAQQIVDSLRTSLEKYKDYHAALADGYQPFLPNLPQEEYHFTNNWHGFLEAFTFDPARPTSLLYKKTSSGYELRGAMFTMPKNATEDQLDARVPLSVASWHLHTNLCMPPKSKEKSSDWTKFGLAGSIATPESCSEAGGRFFPSIFGWMVHVYPYEETTDKIFGHM